MRKISGDLRGRLRSPRARDTNLEKGPHIMLQNLDRFIENASSHAENLKELHTLSTAH